MFRNAPADELLNGAGVGVDLPAYTPLFDHDSAYRLQLWRAELRQRGRPEQPLDVAEDEADVFHGPRRRSIRVDVEIINVSGVGRERELC